MARVLVIDDEESLRFTFQRFLVHEGHDVATAKDYAEAMEIVDGNNPDLIFSDIILGQRTGIDVLREVRERGMGCPVVMITGYPDHETASEALRLGAFDYMPKPVLKDALLRVTDTALQDKARSDERERCRSHMESVFRCVTDGVITVNEQLVVTEINQAAEEICGLSRTAIGQDFPSVELCCEKECLEPLRRVIETNRPSALKRLECRATDGQPRVVSLSIAPLLAGNEEVAGAVMVVRRESLPGKMDENPEERRMVHRMVGRSPEMQRVYSLIQALADVDTTVLITGESGTGKELVAEALHHSGQRSGQPFVSVNCAALSESLLESELFGHVKGAFTGAIKDKAGRFQRANRGTILLDEIGSISPRMQSSLLRVLQEKEFERVGDSSPIRVDVRVIAATNEDLGEKVRRGEFREDLYYRLKVVEIVVPPLRERREDIPLLMVHFLEKFNERFGKRVSEISEDVRRIFFNHPWPGNVRELEHAIEHAVILSRLHLVTVEDLPKGLRDLKEKKEVGFTPRAVDPTSGTQPLLHALRHTAGNKAMAARILGISRRTIYRKMKEHGITEDQISASM